METLSSRRDELTGKLGSVIDHAQMSAVTTELATVQDDLSRTEEEWLELSAQLEIADS